MSVRLKNMASRRKSNVFQFMKEAPGPKSNQELISHVLNFMRYEHGTPQDAVKMLEDYGVDRKKAVGIVKSVVKGRTGGEMDTKLKHANRGARTRQASSFFTHPFYEAWKKAGYFQGTKDHEGAFHFYMSVVSGGPNTIKEAMKWGFIPDMAKLLVSRAIVLERNPENPQMLKKPYALPSKEDVEEFYQKHESGVGEHSLGASRKTSPYGGITVGTRRAKMDLMTGFTGKQPPDLDLGLDGNSYFEKWTTLSLPDTGKNSALDDEQQPSGGGAPATVIPGSPLKTPMEAEDVTRPKLREGREARRQRAGVLRKIASEIRLLDPITARRLMAAADEISYEALSTATLPEAGDESNEVDDYQDNLGHGTLSFFGTDPAKSTSLTRESSRRRRTATEDFTRCEISFKYPGDNWDKVVCKSKEEYDKKMKELKEDGAEVKVRHFDNGEVDTNLQYANRGASRRRSAGEGHSELISYRARKLLEEGKSVDTVVAKLLAMYDWIRAEMDTTRLRGIVERIAGEIAAKKSRPSAHRESRRFAGEGKGVKDIDWTNTLKLVDSALQGKYDRGAVAHILKSDFDRTMGMLKTGQGGQNGEMVPGQQGQHATASRRKAGVDWVDIKGAANDFIQSGKSPEEVDVVDVARNLGLNHREATQALEPVLKEMRKALGEGDPRDRDPQLNQMLGSRRKRARTQGDAPLKPEPTVGDQDGTGADGAGGFADRSKAPLQETMTAQDVERPKIRENPEAARLASLWDAFRSELIRQASGTGKWNSGRYALEARDYGDSVEIQASVVDRENLPMPVGSILFSRINDSPRGRYATVEVNDDILENRTTQFTIQRPRQAGLVVKRLVAGVVQASKDLIDGITV